MRYCAVLLLLFFGLTNFCTAQEFKLELGTYDQVIPKSYFEEAGLINVKLSVDAFDLYRYYIDQFTTYVHAQQQLLLLDQRRFPHCRIVDAERQRILCAQQCNFIRPSYSDIEISSVFFDFGKATITTATKMILDELARILEDNPTISVTLAGHTDAIGSPEKNRILAMKRALAVRQYLQQKGIDIYRLKTQVYGEGAPIALNIHEDGTDAPEGRKYNRRVSIMMNNIEGITLYDATKKVLIPEHLQLTSDKSPPPTSVARH